MTVASFVNLFYPFSVYLLIILFFFDIIVKRYGRPYLRILCGGMNLDINLKNLLTEAKELLKAEVTPISYLTFITPLEIDSVDDNNVVLILNDSFKREHLISRFNDLIENTFSFLLQRKCTFSVLAKNEALANKPVSQTNSTNTSNSTSLNQKYSFSTFVVGDKNRFAHAASIAVAESPGTAYNPLFIYGGVGLGKTHLMQAIGNEIVWSKKTSQVLYVTSEKLMNEFVNALKEAKIEEFRQKYRTHDVLMIDDIQFLTGKERLQEEFFHTFNTLYESEKQIILTSDRPPRDIPLLEDRLKSRFEWGLLADVSMVDYETRLAILRKKTDEKQLFIDDNVLSNIAIKIDSNIRELEGVFNKLVAQSSLTHTPITIEMSERAINDVIRQQSSVMSLEYIQETVGKYFDVSIDALKSSNRSKDIAFARQVGMYLCRILTNESYATIGDIFGKRDHSTVMHAFGKIEKALKEDTNTKLIVESVKKLTLNKEE